LIEALLPVYLEALFQAMGVAGCPSVAGQVVHGLFHWSTVFTCM